VKKVTAFVGSARKRHTYRSVQRLLAPLQSLGDVETEIVRLSEHRLETCVGCKLCCDRGEEPCPHCDDDRDLLIGKMLASDGVVFASPVYTFQVSALMKKFLDRLGFVCHRPRFFGKAFTSVVIQAMHGGPDTRTYLDFVGASPGFNVVKGCCVMSLEPMTEKAQRRNEAVLAGLSRRFYARLSRPAYPVPSLFRLMGFRWGRTAIRLMLDESWRDYTYYRDKGWFESSYFYPTRLSPLKRAFGNVIDHMASNGARPS
jgi:multimeric flavodoxin WrbA